MYFSLTSTSLRFVSGFYSFFRCQQLVSDWFSALRNSSQDLGVYFEKLRENLNFKTTTWIKFGLNLNKNSHMRLNLHLNCEFLKYYFKKRCLGSPCYLMVVSGGSSSSGGLNKDTRRCFLRCLQVSNSSSLLFNIVFGLAVRITSFSVRHRSHARPPLENGWPLALIDQST